VGGLEEGADAVADAFTALRDVDEEGEAEFARTEDITAGFDECRCTGI
jgi:hypothetical protein